MFGSIFYNFWGALSSFTVYFVWALQQTSPQPIPVILQSFVAAMIGFIVMYAVRYLIGYIMYTPEQIVEEEVVEQEGAASEFTDLEMLIQTKDSSIAEFHDEDSEEIAKVVRTMLHGQTEATTN